MGFRDGIETRLPWMELPNIARRSVDGNEGIVTGVYDIPGAIHKTQQEAEKLMLSPKWSGQEG